MDDFQAQKPEQMTLDIGELDEGELLVGSVKVGGRMRALKELKKGDQVRVAIMGMDGEVVAEQIFYCGGIGFAQHRATEKRPAYVERVHALKPEQ